MIYFNGGGCDSLTAGFEAWRRGRNGHSREADIYINTDHQEKYEPNPVKTQMLMDWNGTA